jgi:hypothetical protein
MASGHEYRARRPNTWLLRPMLQSEDSSCQPGAVHTWPISEVASVLPGGSPVECRSVLQGIAVLITRLARHWIATDSGLQFEEIDEVVRLTP